MSVVRRDAARRWVVVVAVTGALVAWPMVLSQRPTAVAGLAPSAVFAAAVASSGVAHQGLAQIDATFGLPDLPFGGDETELLDSTTRVRSWWSGPDAWRADTLLATGQDTTYAVTGSSPSAVRQWSFEESSLVEVPADLELRLPRADDLLPPALARRVLGWAGAAPTLEDLPSRRVAGISAAGARMLTGDPRSTIDHIDLWVDPRSGLPLEVVAYAVGDGRPLIDSRFLSVDVTRPDTALLSPDLSQTVHAETSTVPDFLARVSSLEPTALPRRLGDLGFAGAALGSQPGRVATYGSGFVRVTLVALPGRFMDRVFEDVGPAAKTLDVTGGRALLLTSQFLSLTFVQDTATGQGYALAGAVTSTTLASAVTSLLATQ